MKGHLLKHKIELIYQWRPSFYWAFWSSSQSIWLRMAKNPGLIMYAGCISYHINHHILQISLHDMRRIKLFLTKNSTHIILKFDDCDPLSLQVSLYMLDLLYRAFRMLLLLTWLITSQSFLLRSFHWLHVAQESNSKHASLYSRHQRVLWCLCTLVQNYRPAQKLRSSTSEHLACS